MAGRVFTQGRCFTYINIFNPSALHILPYLILSVPLGGTVPILEMWKLDCLCSSGADFAVNFYSTGLPLERFTNSDVDLHYPATCWVTLHTLWSFEEMCHQLLLNCGWDGNHYLSTGAPFPSPSEINSTGSFVRRLTGVLGGSRPREVMALDLQILITLCVLSSEPHSSLLRKGGQGEGTWTLTVQIEAKS